MRRATLALAAAAGALALPAAAHADQTVSMPGKYFSPSKLTVLAGEPVTWRNDDLISHDVAASGAFVSGPLARASAFTFSFATPGNYLYRCTVHPFMTGQVDVAAVTLQAPAGAVLAGQSVQLTGRAPAGTPRVAIERTLDGTAFSDTGVAATPGADGAFSAMVPAAEGAAFRAVVAAGASTVVRPQVAARVPVALRVHHARRHTMVRVTTAAAGAGLHARLETYRRERFTWRALGGPARLDKRGRAVFHLPRALDARARVVLTTAKGGLPLITSRPVRLRDGRPTRDPLPPAPRHAGGEGHAPAAPSVSPGEHGAGTHGPA